MVHVVLGYSVLIGNELFDRVFLSLLKAAAEKLNVFVLNALLKDEVCTAVEAHCEEVVVASWVLDAVVDHLNQHRGIVAEP